jgi:hypothetical protein
MKITKRQLRRIIKEEINPQGYTEENMHYDDYVSWAKKNGHVTPASSSVLATYVVDSGLDEPAWLSIASDVGIDALDVRMDIARQQKEYDTMGEGMSPDDMPDSWRQILGNCLKGEG